MRTCVCYLEIQRSLGKEGNARFANEGHLRFVSVTFEFHCGHWIARYVSELFSFSYVCHEFLKRYSLSMSQLLKYRSRVFPTIFPVGVPWTPST